MALFAAIIFPVANCAFGFAVGATVRPFRRAMALYLLAQATAAAAYALGAT